MRKLQFSQKLQSFAHGLLCAGLAMLTGCGAGSLAASSTSPQSPASATTSTQLRIGDSPAAKVFSFEITLGSSITFTPANVGAPSVVTLNANRLELSHTAAKLEPIAVSALRPGSYVSAEFSIQSPSVTYAKQLFMPNAVTLIDRFTGNDQTLHINFDPPLTIGSDALVLDLQIDTASSLVLDAGGSVVGTNFKPDSITFSAHPVGPSAAQQDVDGEIEDETGKVVELATGGFVLQTGQSGAQLRFTMDGSTKLPDALASPDLLNRIVKVGGFTRSTGELFASEVQLLGDQNASQLEGTIWQIGSFSNPSLVAMAAQDGIGPGVTVAQVGQDFLMDISALPNTLYMVDFGNCGMLRNDDPALVFDSAHLKAGQRVEVITAAQVNSAQAIAPLQVRLQQQAITGTVTNITPLPGGASAFDIVLPGDSYLKLLSGEARVHVIQEARTDNRFGLLTEGAPVRVRGALLWTGTQFTLVARRITP